MARTAWVVPSHSSACSSGRRSSRLPTSRYGITSRCPLLYGKALRMAKHTRPRHTMWVSVSGRPLARMAVNGEAPPPADAAAVST